MEILLPIEGAFPLTPVDLIEARVPSPWFCSSIGLTSRSGDGDLANRGLIGAIPAALGLKEGGNRDPAICLYALPGLSVPN